MANLNTPNDGAAAQRKAVRGYIKSRRNYYDASSPFGKGYHTALDSVLAGLKNGLKMAQELEGGLGRQNAKTKR